MQIGFYKKDSAVNAHRWFAWRPVSATKGYGYDIGWVWMEDVLKEKIEDGIWKYRVIEKS